MSNPSQASTVDQYRIEIARMIHAANEGKLFSGAPPNPLRSIIVLKMAIDPSGNIESQIFRSNHIRELEQAALASVRQIGRAPMPRIQWLGRNNRVEFYETWLFNDAGRFQLRALALPQQEAD